MQVGVNPPCPRVPTRVRGLQETPELVWGVLLKDQVFVVMVTGPVNTRSRCHKQEEDSE